MKKVIGLILGLMLCVSSVYAQSVPGTLTQQSPTRLDAQTNCTTATGAAAAAVTATITPTGGNSVYLVFLEVTNNRITSIEYGNSKCNSRSISR
jgi:hypothetical protein